MTAAVAVPAHHIEWHAVGHRRHVRVIAVHQRRQQGVVKVQALDQVQICNEAEEKKNAITNSLHHQQNDAQ